MSVDAWQPFDEMHLDLDDVTLDAEQRHAGRPGERHQKAPRRVLDRDAAGARAAR